MVPDKHRWSSGEVLHTFNNIEPYARRIPHDPFEAACCGPLRNAAVSHQPQDDRGDYSIESTQQKRTIGCQTPRNECCPGDFLAQSEERRRHHDERTNARGNVGEDGHGPGIDRRLIFFFFVSRCSVSGYLLSIRKSPNVSHNVPILQQKFKMLFLPTGLRYSGGGGDQSDEGKEVIREEIAMTRENHRRKEKVKGRAHRKYSKEIGPGPTERGRKEVDDGRQRFSFLGGGWFVGPIHRLPLWSTVVNTHTLFTAYFLLSANPAELNWCVRILMSSCTSTMPSSASALPRSTLLFETEWQSALA